MTAATQPSIEDTVLGQIPWIPKITLHNPFLAAANGDDFLKPFPDAAEGKMENSSKANIKAYPRYAGLGLSAKSSKGIDKFVGIPRNAPRGTAPSDSGLESSPLSGDR
jgi:hypothetical protein